MILPSKHLSQERALLTVGANILLNMKQPKTVSALWEEIKSQRERTPHLISTLSYDGFVLALDLLYLIGTVELEEGLLKRRTP